MGDEKMGYEEVYGCTMGKLGPAVVMLALRHPPGDEVITSNELRECQTVGQANAASAVIQFSGLMCQHGNCAQDRPCLGASWVHGFGSGYVAGRGLRGSAVRCAQRPLLKS